MLILLGLLSVSSCQKENLELSRINNTPVKSNVEKESISAFFNKASVQRMNNVFFENKDLLDDFYMKDNARSLNPNRVPYIGSTNKDLKPLIDKFYGVGLEFLETLPFTRKQLIKMTGKDDLSKLSIEEITAYSLFAFVMIKQVEQNLRCSHGEFRGSKSLSDCFREVIGTTVSLTMTAGAAAGGTVALTEMVASAATIVGGPGIAAATIAALTASIAWCMW